MLAGFPLENVRQIGTDQEFRVSIGRLRHHIDDDRGKGFRPFAVVGNAGTTNTGAVDDLEELANLCEDEGLWLHVDAA